MLQKIHLILLILNVIDFIKAQNLTYETNSYSDNLITSERPCNFQLDSKNAHTKTPQIIKMYGYPSETHTVTTVDGYILQIHRIPAPGKPPFFLMHRVCSSSRDFVINCERRALAFKLTDGGYDVWLGNVRGNVYTSHQNFSMGNSKFWDFSNDEMAQIDAPTMIDYVLNNTGMTKLGYIGMSMGNAIGLMMLSSRTEYNDKINIWFAMGASLELQRTKSLVIRFLTRHRRMLGKVMRKLNHGEIFPPRLYHFLNSNVPIFCSSERQTRNSDGICSNLWFLLDGYDPGQVPPEVWSVLVGEVPGRNSVKSLVHWFQWIDSGVISTYDYGFWGNLIHYGSLSPKVYPIDKITTSVIIFGAQNDYITTQGTVDDVMKSVRRLTRNSKIDVVPVKSSRWNHVDFIHGKDSDILVYSHILDRLHEIYQN